MLKKIILYLFWLLLVLGFATVVAEAVARMIEPKVIAEGVKGIVPHDVLGWLPAAGQSTVTTHEYSVTYDINSHYMNDKPVHESVDKAKVRIMVVGDSHTFAVGVAQSEAWPNALEQMLFQGNLEAGTVYNCAVFGYNLGQYLLRMRALQDELNPQIVLVGFSSATDLYDLLPPRLGGFVYGSWLNRTFFDLDEEGNLIQFDGVKENGGRVPNRKTPRSLSIRIREQFERLALYRRFKRSKLALWIAMNVRRGGSSLWSGIDTVLKKNLDLEDQYRWQLAEALIRQIGVEARAKGAEVVLVNIPYLPQVYDEVWEASFGRLPQYDRWVGGKRLAAICKQAGIYYVDPTEKFAAEARRTQKRLHFREDGHPNLEGHRIIAESVFKTLVENNLVSAL